LSKRNRLIAGVAGVVLLAFPLTAQADVLGTAGRLADGVDGWFNTAFGAAETQPMQPLVHPRPALTARTPTPAHVSPATLSKMDPIKVAPPPPSVEKPLRRIFCVEYARMRSGLAIMGDAKFWWNRARNLYARLSHPVEEAVMVFSGSKRLKRGHVAVVTHIVSPREIIVDQANWQNHGEIDHAMPVLDVSKANDWSRVRVWNIRAGQFGTHVYAISGFIAKDLMRQASND
jgi:hypothetical protein